MRCKLHSVWDCSAYDILDKYPQLRKLGVYGGSKVAYIDIETLDDLKALNKLTNNELIVDFYDDPEIIIYDDYIE